MNNDKTEILLFHPKNMSHQVIKGLFLSKVPPPNIFSFGSKEPLSAPILDSIASLNLPSSVLLIILNSTDI